MPKEFNDIVGDICNNETVLKMKNYRQHFNTNCYDHCYNASKMCYKITKKLKLDYKSATRAAMLHDLFLYDWRTKEGRDNIHAFTHGNIACANSLKIFDLNSKEQDIIKTHMWPVTIKPPKSPEGFILTLVDKYCTLKEGFNYLNYWIDHKILN